MAESDLARSIQHEPDRSWPTQVKLQLIWEVQGRPVVRSAYIDADQFFGRGQFGAPLEGTAIINMIEHMRRAGPPPFRRIARGKKR